MNRSIEFKGNFINSEFVRTKKPCQTWKSISPSDLNDLVIYAEENYEDVDMAVEAASIAYKSWRKLSIDERKSYILRLKEVFVQHKEEIAICISRETGKILWDAREEAGALINKIDITINDSLSLIADQKIQAAPGVTGMTRYRPRGVMAIVGPFNFPAHLANGHIIPALLTGNTVVYKASELCPAVGQIYAECMQKAGLPKGVFNLLQGKAETGKKLVSHSMVSGVLFTGSYDTGLKISQDIIHQYWKISALEMGGKNASIVWDDANIDKAIYENIFAAYASTGQRCSCTSRIIVHKKIKDQFIERFHQTAKALKIGHWSQDNFMGPLISESASDKYLRFQEIALREGAECVMRGKVLSQEHKGFYVSPSIYYVEKSNPKSVYEKEEIFGPNVCFYSTDDLSEAFALANNTSYGLAAAIFTKDESKYAQALSELDTGLVNWNRATCGASSKLPFGGTKKSGNNRPTAHHAVYYCTIPVASLEDSNDFDPQKIAPGVSLK